jgi:hypothetical protein
MKEWMMTTRFSYPGMIRSISVGSFTSSTASMWASTHSYHRLTECELSDPIKIPNFTAEQWLSVLVLSTKYDMATIRESTIEQLQIVSPRLDPIRQIVAARKFDCAVLVDEPIQALVTRAERLTLEEMGSLPIADLHAIVDRREGRAGFRCSWCSCTSNRCNNCGRSPSSLPPVDF